MQLDKQMMEVRFQSTHPTRGATYSEKLGKWAVMNFNPRTQRGVRPYRIQRANAAGIISIHAPNEGCDRTIENTTPRTVRFQSTHPTRGATENAQRWWDNLRISIHAPNEGCDPEAHWQVHGRTYFNPRTQRGVRQLNQPYLRGGIQFQSTHPTRGATF